MRKARDLTGEAMREARDLTVRPCESERLTEWPLRREIDGVIL